MTVDRLLPPPGLPRRLCLQSALYAVGSGVFEGTNADWVVAGITSVAVQSYGSTSPGGTVDAIRVSNNPTAQQDVTGAAPVPEPGRLALGTLAIGALLTRRRRR